jgi:hypothetical protein
MCQTLTGQVVWQVVRRDGDQVAGKRKWSTRDFMGPLDSVVLVQTQQEACGRLKIYTHVTFCTNYAVWEWVIQLMILAALHKAPA